MVRGAAAPAWAPSSEVENTIQREHFTKQARAVAVKRFGISLHQWQAEAIADVCMKRDVVVSAGTGSGKSIIFQCLPYMKRYGIIMVISPLLSIMHDQVSWLQSMKIAAVSLTAEDILAHPKLWGEVQNGKHRVVYAAPEALLSSDSYFWTNILRNKSRFMDNLLAIAVDEAHVVWGYRQFRHEYANLGDLRAHLRSVPVVSLSATLTPNVLGYIHRVLLMASPTVIYRRPLGRRNVTLAVVPIPGPRGNSHALLNFLINPAKRASFTIPKAFVFVDNVDEAHRIASHLRGLLNPALRHRGRDIIKVMSASLEPSTRSRSMEGLRDGTHRIFVGTEVVAMGINFPDVDIIVQWGLVEHLTLASVWQRIGRAARDPSRKAIAAIFVEESYLLHQENDAAGNENGYYYGWRQVVEESRQAQVYEFISRIYKTVDEQNIRCALDKVDPSLLFLLNTAGCRWRAGLALFGDPSWINADDLPPTPEHEMPSYCCDNCFFARYGALEELQEYAEEQYFVNGLDLRRTIAFTYTSEYTANLYTAYFEKHFATAGSRMTSGVDISSSTAALEDWRAQEYARWVQHSYPSLPMSGFLSDGAIKKIIGSISRIKSKEDLAATLLPIISLENSILDPAVDSLLNTIISLQPAQLPPPVPRRRLHDFDHIPEDQLDMNIPSQARLAQAQRLIAENDAAIRDRAMKKKSEAAIKQAEKSLAAYELSSWNEKAQRVNLKTRSEARQVFVVPPLPRRREGAVVSVGSHARSLETQTVEAFSSATGESTTTPRRPASAQKSISTPKRPASAQGSTSTPKRPSLVQKPNTTPRATCAQKSTSTPRRPASAQKSTSTPRKPASAQKSTSTPRRPASAQKSTAPSTPKGNEPAAPIVQIPPATPNVRRGPARVKANIKFKTRNEE